jgi:hypothetical protein
MDLFLPAPSGHLLCSLSRGKEGVCRLAHSGIRGSLGKTHKFFAMMVMKVGG